MTVKLIWVATVISIATYVFWHSFPKGFFYTGNAVFILLLSVVIFIQNKDRLVSFFLLCIAFNNLMDELFFDPTKLEINEIIITILIPIFYYARKNKQRIIYFLDKNNIPRIFGSRYKNSYRNEKE